MLFDAYVYMTRIGDLDNPVMGCVVKRMWWKPWRWSVQPLYYSRPIVSALPGAAVDTREGEPVYNLTKLGVAGMLKLFGVCTDFSEFSGEPK